MSDKKGTGLADLLAMVAGREAERVSADLREDLGELAAKVRRLEGKLLLLEVRGQLMDSLPPARR